MNTKKLSLAALLLALSIAFQFLKSVSVYITGPVINCILIICVIFCGIKYATILSLILPVTSFIITGSPVISAIPAILPCIMIGNEIIVLSVWLFTRNTSSSRSFILGMVSGSILKSVFMAAAISWFILSVTSASSALPEIAIATAKYTFSAVQLITALLGSFLAFIVVKAIKKSV